MIYMRMDQSEQCSSAYNRLATLNAELMSLSSRRVNVDLLDRIKQKVLTIRPHSAITATDFCNLLQFESKDLVLRDLLLKGVSIKLDKIEVYEKLIIINYTVCAGPFRYSRPSFKEFTLFTYGQAQVDGVIQIFVEGV